jgi:hypothetical protein
VCACSFTAKQESTDAGLVNATDVKEVYNYFGMTSSFDPLTMANANNNIRVRICCRGAHLPGIPRYTGLVTHNTYTWLQKITCHLHVLPTAGRVQHGMHAVYMSADPCCTLLASSQGVSNIINMFPNWRVAASRHVCGAACPAHPALCIMPALVCTGWVSRCLLFIDWCCGCRGCRPESTLLGRWCMPFPRWADCWSAGV